MNNEAPMSRSSTITSAPYALPLPYSPQHNNSSAHVTHVSVSNNITANQGTKRKLDEAFNGSINGPINGPSNGPINGTATHNISSEKLKEQEFKRKIMQMAIGDKQKAINPDYVTPFATNHDMLQRLLCYHLFTATNFKDEEFDNEYNRRALDIATKIDKIKTTYEKFAIKYPVQGKEDKLLLDKLTYFDEKLEIEHYKSRLGIPKAPSITGGTMSSNSSTGSITTLNRSSSTSNLNNTLPPRAVSNTTLIRTTSTGQSIYGNTPVYRQLPSSIPNSSAIIHLNTSDSTSSGNLPGENNLSKIL